MINLFGTILDFSVYALLEYADFLAISFKHEGHVDTPN